MQRDIFSLLDTLLAHWSRPVQQQVSSRQLIAEINQLADISLDRDALRAVDQGVLRSKLLDMAQEFGNLSARLPQPSSWAEMEEMHYATLAAGGCCKMALTSGLAVSSNDAFRMAAPARLVLRQGQALLAEAERAGLFSPADSEQRAWCCRACCAQAILLGECVDLVQQAGVALEAFAATCGQGLVRWVATMARILPTDAAAMLSESVGADLHCNFALVLHAIAAEPAFARQPGLQPDEQVAALDALLLRSLPFLTAWLSSHEPSLADNDARGNCAQPLGLLPNIARAMLPALGRLLCQPGGAAAVANVGQVFEALPVGVPGGMSAVLRAQVQQVAAELLIGMSFALPAAPPPGEGIPLDMQGHGRSRAQHVLVEQALAAVPHTGPMLRAIAADSPAELRWTAVAGAAMLETCLTASPTTAAASWQQLAPWLAAADASVRLLALVSELSDRLAAAEAGGDPASGSSSQWLARAAVGVWRRATDCLADFLRPSGGFGSMSAQEAAVAAPLLWQLHSTGCRWLHGQASGRWALPPGVESSSHWKLAHRLLSMQVLGLLSVTERASSARHHMPAVCGAHWAVLQASPAATQGSETVVVGIGPEVASALLAVAEHCPAVVNAQLMGMLERVLVEAMDPATLAKFLAAGVLQHLREEPSQRPWVAAAAMQGRVPLILLDAADSAEREGDLGKARRLRAELWLLMDALAAAYRSISSRLLSTCGCGGGGGNGTGAEAGLLRRLQVAWEGYRVTASSALGPVIDDRAASQALRARLQPAAKLAALLLEWRQLPEQRAEAALQLAQAAATRSCAYLRCANLALGGGPAAGQGKGSLKCSACRAVWYCGTACSHADWRGPGGHKHVCRALGVARAAERAAARAAQQAEGGAA